MHQFVLSLWHVLIGNEEVAFIVALLIVFVLWEVVDFLIPNVSQLEDLGKTFIRVLELVHSAYNCSLYGFRALFDDIYGILDLIIPVLDLFINAPKILSHSYYLIIVGS
jgi:hypothetical protein